MKTSQELLYFFEHDIVELLNQIHEDLKAKWGTMDAHRMVEHLTLGFKIANALKHSGVNIAGYIDNDTNKTGCFNNQIECKSIDYIENKLLDSYVIIAVIESIEAVQYQLLSFGLDINNIFYKRAEREKVGDDFRNYLVNCVVGCLAWEDKTSLRTKILSDSDLINEAYIKLADDKSREIFISRIALALDGERYGPLTHFLNSFSDTVIENRSKYKNSIYAPRPLPEFKYYFIINEI